MKKILVPFDFSQVSVHALDLAVQIAKKNSSYVGVLNVIEHPSESSLHVMGVHNLDPMEEIYIKKMIEKTKVKLEEVLEKYAELKDNIGYKIRIGNAFHSVIEEVVEGNTDLAVVGVHDSTEFDEFFLSSNAEKILSKIKCPTITIQEEVELEPIDKILFVSRFEELEDEMMSRLKELQEFNKAELGIVKINTPGNFSTTREDQERLKNVLKKYKLENVVPSTYNETSVAQGILNASVDLKADMIVLENHRNKRISHLLWGNHVEQVVKHSKIPVWVYPLD